MPSLTANTYGAQVRDSLNGIDSQSHKINQFATSDLKAVAKTIDQQDRVPDHIYESAVQLGLFASNTHYDDAEPHGGIRRLQYLMSLLASFAETSPAFAKSIMDQNIGQIGMLREFGSDSFKTTLLTEISTGQRQAAFAMTEPHGGSNPSAFTTTARPVGDGHIINGVKDWITGAERRTAHFVVARSTADNALGLFVVDRTDETNAGRVQIGKPKNKLGLRGLGEHRVEYRDAFVPTERVVIEPSPRTIGKIMYHYNVKRAGQAAICIGASKGALRSAFEYAGNRHSQASEAHANMRTALARQVTALKASETLLEWALNRLAAGDRTGVPSGIVKVHTSEMAISLISAAAQVCGASGLSDELPIERLFRDVRMLSIAGGATEVVLKTVSNRLSELI